MKRILVPTDFSDCAATALEYAALWAAKLEAEIILVHACDLLRPHLQTRKGLVKEYNHSQTVMLRRRLEALRMQAEEAYKVQVITRLYEGDPAATIIQAVNDNGADLVVMGTMGASNTLNLVFGSLTASLIGKSPVPVIAVPERYTPAAPKSILLATSGAVAANIASILFEISELFAAELTLVAYEPDADEPTTLLESGRSISQVAGSLQRYNPSMQVHSEIIGGNDLYTALEQCIHKNEAGLLAMITHQAHSLFSQSITRKMSYRTDVPLLAIPAHLK